MKSDRLLTQHLKANLDLLEEAHQLVRNLARDLDSKILDDLGLAPAIRQHVSRVSGLAQIPIHLHINGRVRRLPSNIERLVFRGLQETLANALHHARPSEISAQLHLGSRYVRLTVEDDGCGFDIGKLHAGTQLGLPDLKRQVQALRGEFILDTSPGNGTLVALRLPFHSTDHKSSKARVLIVDDHEITRHGTRQMLAGDSTFLCIGEAVDGTDGLRQAEFNRPNLILMDVKLPQLNGIEATRQIVRRLPTMRVVMLTYHADETYLEQSLEAGAKGYLLKSDPSEQIIAALHRVMAGEVVISPAMQSVWRKLQAQSISADPLKLLTLREREVLQLAIAGHSNHAIGKQLGISGRTVEVHRHNIADKLGTRNTAQLIQFAVQNSLLEKTP